MRKDDVKRIESKPTSQPVGARRCQGIHALPPVVRSPVVNEQWRRSQVELPPGSQWHSSSGDCGAGCCGGVGNQLINGRGGYETTGANDHARELTFVEELVDRVARDAAQSFAGFIDGVKVAIPHGERTRPLSNLLSLNRLDLSGPVALVDSR